MIDDARARCNVRSVTRHDNSHGPKCAEFETAFAEYVGVKHAISTSNCTTAIHLGLIACGVGYGDEVIVPAMTHVARRTRLSIVVQSQSLLILTLKPVA